ncbi:PhzF family phenazine biosynthesis protein [Sphingomonas sanxanigenens]
MMIDRRYGLVDVFHDGPFSGNPLAVVHAAEALDPETMQRMARWFNLSETTFLLPPTAPGADYRVRIFTLERELPFAGHPTLGTCHAWLEAGGVPRDAGRIVQQCGAGLIPIRRDGERLAFAPPPLLRAGAVDAVALDQVVEVLRIDPADIVECRWADNGPGWIGVMLKSAEAVLAVEPLRFHEARIEIGLVGAHPAGAPVDWEIRTIFSDATGTLIEDPVTGSFNAAVAMWLRETGRADDAYIAAQGTRLGRRGRVFVDYEGDVAWIGGRVRTMVAGTLDAG